MSQLEVVDAGDIIDLNVGGEFITTTRGTLTSAEGSMLAAMFSGRWEDQLTLDKDGRVFLDLSPYAIRKIVEYLRLKRLTEKDAFLAAPEVTFDRRAEYNSVVRYLGLEKMFGASVSFQLCNIDSTLQVTRNHIGGTHLFYTGSGHKGFYTDTPVPVGASWKVKVCMPNAGWQFLGIIAQNDVSTALREKSYSVSSSYGWAGGNQVYSGGVDTPGLRSGYTSICTSTYYFQLRDTELLMLQEAHGGEKKIFRLTIPANCSYVIHLNMHANQTQLDLEKATSEVFGQCV